MKKKLNWAPALVALALGLCVLSSCRDEIDDNDSYDSSSVLAVSTEDAVEGVVRIKLQAPQASALSLSLKSGSVSTSITNIDSVLSSIGATSFKRTFPYAGKFEARTVAAGLHLWYDIKYDTLSVDIDDVVSDFAQLSEVDITEPIRRKTKLSVGDPVVYASLKNASLSNYNYQFDDTYISLQWHYYNDGSVVNSIAGCDINLMDAWKKQTGSSDVIVSVVDGGIDVDHDDLAANMWINEDEYNGVDGVDDDNNGYVDDIYGYNFVSGSGTIEEHTHGTHVAGTIGAVNGNGTGVAGVAGGDGTTQGVQLMSCQVFQSDDDSDDDLSADDFEAAIKYGADNGAVISQNSWGYDGAMYLPTSMKEAIDYFIEYAGYDENGNQTGPMAGGVVIFAAGNDYSSTNAYPAMYDEVIAVAACNPDYTLSYYSNYGSWVDITAPGGTDEVNNVYDNWIVSTYTDNGYGYAVGTSMACPHVSGVAALVLSEFGGDGFTPSDLKEKLYQGAIDLDAYNPDYEGMMGVGLVNAAGALGVYGTAPEVVSNLDASVEGNDVTLEWLLTADDDDVKASGYRVYYATSSFSQDDVDNGLVDYTTITTSSAYEVGDSISATVSGLDYESTYYFAVAGYDYAGTRADISPLATATIDGNAAPVITSEDGDSFELKAWESMTLNLYITEPDGEDYTWELEDESGNVETREYSSYVRLSIDAVDYDAGSYSATLVVTDEFGQSASYTITYTILENHAPETSQELVYFYIGDPEEEYVFDLADYISDEDGEDLDYDLSYDSDLLSARTDDDELTITSNSYGLASIDVTATDAKGESCTMEIVVMMRDDDSTIDVYPNPVSDYVYFRMGEDVDGSLQVAVYNSNGVLVQESTEAISTYVPASMDLSDLASGEYTLKMTYEGEEMETDIVKL